VKAAPVLADASDVRDHRAERHVVGHEPGVGQDPRPELQRAERDHHREAGDHRGLDGAALEAAAEALHALPGEDERQGEQQEQDDGQHVAALAREEGEREAHRARDRRDHERHGERRPRAVHDARVERRQHGHDQRERRQRGAAHRAIV
jgi:hypothetical protein